MASRTTLLGFLAAMLLAVGSRTDGLPGSARKTAGPTGNRLAKPVPIEIDGRSLAGVYPFVGDIDGDGRQDLLLGTRSERLLVYRNTGTGTGTGPRLSGPRWFDDAVPTGRIPKG